MIVTMSVTGRDPQRELDLVRALRGQRPRVIILAGSRSVGDADRSELSRELQAFQDAGGRVVFVSQRELGFDTVLIDNYDGARQLADQLAGLGYRRFAAIVGNRALLTVRDRLAGFTDGLSAHGIELDPARIVETEFTRDGGYDGVARLVADGIDDIELVFAANDVMAIGAMSALRDSGIEPGTDVAVAGFDDIQSVRDVTPALTTVRIPLVEVGRVALDLALGHGSPGALNSVPLGTEVVLRASTPPRTG